MKVLLQSLTGLALVAATAAPAVASGIKPNDAIQHVVVIFQENVSFDHYFGVYPHASNPSSEPAFTPVPNTPSVDGYTEELLRHNANFANSENGAGRRIHFGWTAAMRPLPIRITITVRSSRPSTAAVWTFFLSRSAIRTAHACLETITV